MIFTAINNFLIYGTLSKTPIKVVFKYATHENAQRCKWTITCLGGNPLGIFCFITF